MRNIIKLKQGDLVALTSPINLPPKQYQDFKPHLEYLKAQGLNPLNLVAKGDSAKQRFNSLNAGLHSGARAIFLTSGNRYEIKNFGRIDLEALKENKPLITTYSAASTMLLYMYEKVSLNGLYGPHLSFMHSQSDHRELPFTLNSFWRIAHEAAFYEENILQNKEFSFKNYWHYNNPFSDEDFKLADVWFHKPPFIKLNTDNEHSTKGVIYPVFLQSLLKYIESGENIDFSDKILLIESDQTLFSEGLKLFQVLHQKSNIAECKAVYIAGFTHHPFKYSSQEKTELYDPQHVNKFLIELKKILSFNKPILYGFPLGHGRLKYTVPIGVQIELDCSRGKIRFI